MGECKEKYLNAYMIHIHCFIKQIPCNNLDKKLYKFLIYFLSNFMYIYTYVCTVTPQHVLCIGTNGLLCCNKITEYGITDPDL